ncbi:MAG: hypothetical protein IT384_22395 [Deltaproteobacteria bacterium]|nr:hypothetical protein [Deltaproteobacteria bacterium]
MASSERGGLGALVALCLAACGVEPFDALLLRTQEGPCPQIESIGPVTVLPAEVRDVRPVLTDGAWVYFHLRDRDGKLGVHRVDVSSGEQRDFPVRRLLDARGRGVLWASPAFEEDVSLYWDTVDGVSEYLSTTPYRMPVEGWDLRAPFARAIMPRTAGWLERDGSVWGWRRQAKLKLSDRFLSNDWPDAEDEVFAWVAREPGSALVLVNRAEGLSVLSSGDANVEHPVVRHGDVVWLEDGAMMLAAGDQTPPRVLHEGPCLPAASGSGRVVFTCAPAHDPGMAPLGSELFLYDGGPLRSLPTKGGRILAPRTGYGVVAWVEYPADTACAGPQDRHGTIWLLDLNESDPHPIPVASIGAPCWCCDAQWPSVELSVASDAIAWNYALSADGSRADRRIGFAPIKKFERCRAPDDP